MPELGKKYTCYSCHTKFYDLGKPIPKCPKCGADQRDADEAPVVTTTRGRRAVPEPEPIEEPEFADSEPAAATGDEEEDEIIPTTDDREEEAEEEEEEEY